jgi:hypothetical protein
VGEDQSIIYGELSDEDEEGSDEYSTSNESSDDEDI